MCLTRLKNLDFQMILTTYVWVYIAEASSKLNISDRSGESESTGTRSESSTPIQRCSLSRFSPMSGSIGSTRCQLCDMNFDTPTELSVHFHSYHIVMRHGQNFKCPRKNCEKICLSRESLRVHVSTHFFGLGNSGNLNNGSS